MSPRHRHVLIARVLILSSVLTLAACGGESAFSRRGAGAGGTPGSGGSGPGSGGAAGMAGNDGGPTGGVSGTGGGQLGGRSGSGGMDRDGSPGSGGVGPGVGGSDGGTDSDAGADANNGIACTNGSQCTSGNCVDNICCDQPCTGTCYTCASAASPGTCVPAEGGTDPRNECDDKGVTSCGTTGVCNGAGACRVYAAGQVCNPTPSCNATNTAVIPSYVCNGAGACVAGAPQDCKGFVCAAAACGTTCTSDATCATGAFCAAGGCVPGPANLAGNGDLEYGTTVGWDRFGGGGTLSISSTAASGVAHGGQYSAVVTGRAQPYQGPSYDIPTGLGRYVISAWGMQQADSTLTGILQIALLCNTTTQYVNVQTSGFGIAMPKDTWTQFSATIDTSAGVAADCLATATPPGVIRRATLYLNQSGAGTPTADPDLFMDDVVVQVTDGHNLVANSTFEAGVPSGWAVSGAGTLAVSATAVANGGTKSLFVSGRTTSISGPSYPLPIGAAKYSITFHAMHAGASVHDLVLQSSYTCVGGAPTTPPAIATAAATPGNTWTTLAGTVTLPPLNATAGCRLTQAEVHVQQEAASCGTIECPDIYVDDVAITVAP